MMIKKMGIWVVTLFLLSLYSVTSIQAETVKQEAVTMEVRLGFDGVQKNGGWIPVEVTVANLGSSIVGGYIEVRTGSNSQQIVYREPIDLPTQSNKQVTIYVYPNSSSSMIEVFLVDGNEKEIKKARLNSTILWSENSLMYLVASSDPDEFNFLTKVTGAQPDGVSSFVTVEQLPENGTAWQGVDILILNDVDTSGLNGAQKEALDRWLEMGGVLVVTGGANWQKTVSGIADYLPVEVSGTVTVDDIPVLRDVAQRPFRDAGPYILTNSRLTNGELVWHQDGLPILARRTVGNGSVYFLAVDPTLAPLVDWDGAVDLWQVIALSATPEPFWAGNIRDDAAASTSVTGQSIVKLPSPLQMFLFLFSYVLVIGPVNYFSLKRINRKELAWITIPAIILLFSGVAYLIGYQLKGTRPVVRQMSVVYGVADGDWGKTTSVMGVYSPRRESYTLTLPNGDMARPFDSGINSRFGVIERGNQLQIKDMIVDVGGTQTLIVEGYEPLLNVTGKIELTTVDNQAVLQIDIFNQSDKELQHLNILLGNRLFEIGTLGAGERYSDKVTMNSGSFSGSNGYNSYYGSSNNSPLSRHLDAIVGGSYYYDDLDLTAKAELIQSLTGYDDTQLYVPTNRATLIFWVEEPLVEAELSGGFSRSEGVTLYFLELPYEQEKVAVGSELTISTELFDWSVLGDSGLYDISLNNLYLFEGWVEFEFVPWSQFSELEATELQVKVDTLYGRSGLDVRLWDWDAEIWVQVNEFKELDEHQDDGYQKIKSFARYIGNGNEIRLRLRNDNSSNAVEIGEIGINLIGDIK